MQQIANGWQTAAQTISLKDIYGPRYTSYPTALQFHEELRWRDVHAAIVASNAQHRPLSLYFHIPFCEHVCYYCACNRIVTGNKKLAEDYLARLIREMDHYCSLVNAERPVIQLHLGGGTPTYFSDAQLTELMYQISRRFNLSSEEGHDFSVEVDPRTVTESRLALLKGLGFNRISMGVQDLDSDVQHAINRVQSAEEIAELTQSARALGFRSINYDLIYGLPKQSTESLQRTLAKVVEMNPDRIAMYAYAHLPQRFKVQRQIHSEDLPGGEERLQMLKDATDYMQQNGYDFIGMDHFARYDDTLSKAKRSGDLHRNFQGYTCCRDSDLLAFGCSSISKVGNVYWQNYKSLNEYNSAIDEHGRAIERGYISSSDDLIRANVIETLLCQGEVDFSQFEQQHGVAFDDYFATELAVLRQDNLKNLVELSETGLKISDCGRYLARRVCLVFDIYNGNPQSGQQFSRIV